MAGTLTVQNIQGPSSGANANKIIIPSGQTLDASAGFVPPAGSVVQVVQSVNTASSAASANVWLEGNLTGTITPSSASSKILVIFDLPNIYCNASTDRWAYITRNGTNLFSSYTTGNNTKSGVNGYSLLFYEDGREHANITYLDAPATTSSCQYKWYHLANSGTVYDNYSIDRGVQTLTLMEIAG